MTYIVGIHVLLDLDSLLLSFLAFLLSPTFLKSTSARASMRASCR